MMTDTGLVRPIAPTLQQLLSIYPTFTTQALHESSHIVTARGLESAI